MAANSDSCRSTLVYGRPSGIGRYAPIKHAVGDRQSSAIYQLRSSAFPARHSLPPEATDISVGRDLALVAASSSGRCAAAAGSARPAARHDDEAQLAGRRDVRWPSSIHPAFPRWPRDPDGRLIRPAGRPSVATVHFPPQLNPINLRHPSVGESERPVDRRTQVPPASKLRQIYRLHFVINSRRPVVLMSTYTIRRGIFTGVFSTISHCS